MARNRILLVLSAIAVVFLLIVPGAAAFETRTGQDVVIEAGQTVPDDLYVAAESIRIDGTVQGDVVAAGNEVVVGGVVEGDLIVASQSTVISGSIGDDLRVATAAFTLSQEATIGDDLMGAGFSFETLRNSTIGGSALVAGAQARFAGEIVEDLRAATSGLVIDGVVGGNVQAEVGEPGQEAPFSPLAFMPNAPAVPSIPSGLHIGPSAEIRGDLSYRSTSRAEVPTGAIGGSVDFSREIQEMVQAEAEPTLLEQVLDRARAALALLLVGVLLIWVTPGSVSAAAAHIETRPAASLGWGVMMFIAVIAALVALVAATALLMALFGVATLSDLLGTTLVLGMTGVGLVSVLFGLALAYLTKIPVLYLVGRLLLKPVAPDAASGRLWPLLTGVVLLSLLLVIPILGTLANWAAILLGFGAMWQIGRDFWRSRREAPPASPQPAVSPQPAG